MAYIPEVSDLRRIPDAFWGSPKSPNATVSVDQLRAEYQQNPKKFKKKKQLSPVQKQGIRCGYDLKACQRDVIDSTFHGM